MVVIRTGRWLSIRAGTSTVYGTTYAGGAHNDGTVFEFSASGTYIVLYSFGSFSGDGLFPNAGVIFDKRGNLFGTTSLGGTNGVGTVYAVNPSSGKEQILHNFSATNGDGVQPYAGVVFDSTQSHLYGTTPSGCAFDEGTVYQVSLPGLQEVVLYNFTGGADGSVPFGNVILDSKGSIYGTASQGGRFTFGTVWRLTP